MHRFCIYSLWGFDQSGSLVGTSLMSGVNTGKRVKCERDSLSRHFRWGQQAE